MHKLARLLALAVKAAVFFALFAFALNNQHEATLHLLLGRQWRAPVMLIVLAAFALGMVAGVLGMLPGWWSRRRAPRADEVDVNVATPAPASASTPGADALEGARAV